MVMATTIQVSDETRQLLELVKEEQHAASLDEAISVMAHKQLKIPASLSGKFKDMRWKKSDRLVLHEL